MADDEDESEDPRDAEIRRLKSEKSALERRVARLRSQLRAADQDGRRRPPGVKRTLDAKAASSLDRPWDGR